MTPGIFNNLVWCHGCNANVKREFDYGWRCPHCKTPLPNNGSNQRRAVEYEGFEIS